MSETVRLVRFAAHSTMRCMIGVEMPGAERYASIALRWFDAGFCVFAPEQRAALQTGPKLPPEAIRRPMPYGSPRQPRSDAGAPPQIHQRAALTPPVGWPNIGV